MALLNVRALEERVMSLAAAIRLDPWTCNPKQNKPTDPTASDRFNIVKSAVETILGAEKQRGAETWKDSGIPVVVDAAAKKDPEKACLASRGLKLGKLVGHGAFGKTYKAKRGDRVVAAKIETVHPWRLRNIHSVLQGIKASVIAGNVGVGPKVHDVFVCYYGGESNLVTVMDLVDGVVWSEFVRTASNEARYAAIEILKKKVALMHSHKIMHKDLHQGNVMVVLGPQKTVKDVAVIDFGLSVRVNSKYVFENDDEALKRITDLDVSDLATCVTAELVRQGIVVL